MDLLSLANVDANHLQTSLLLLGMARALVKQEKKVVARKYNLQTVDGILELEFHMSMRPIAIVVLAISKQFQER
jgi:hypothetical protein